MDNGIQFEGEIADLYRVMGYEIEQNVVRFGQEVDIEATRTVVGSGRYVLWIECKFKSGTRQVSNEDVQAIAGAFHIARQRAEADACVLVTTNGFSREAQYAAQAAGIKLMTRRDLVRSLLDRTTYARRLRNEFASRFGAGEESWYVAQRARLNKANAAPLEEIVDAWLARPERRPLAVLGGYGIGKSSFCLRYAVRLLDRQDSPLPVILRLREFTRAFKLESLVRDFLDEQIETPQPRFELFWRMFEAGQLLVFFDGFDEMAERVDAATLEANITAIDRFARLGHVILTCRPEFFVNRREQEFVLQGPGAASAERHAVYDIAELELWSNTDVALYIRRRLGGLPASAFSADYYVDRMERLPGLNSLSTRPVHLELILRVLPQLVEQGDRLDRPTLFATYLREEFRRETVVNGRLRVMSDADRLRLLTEIVAGQLGAGVDQLDFEHTARMIRQHLAVSDSELESVTRDFLNRSFLNRSGDTYRFAHKAIGEYLLSIELHRRLIAGDLSWLSASPGLSALVAGLVLDHLGGQGAYSKLLTMIGLDDFEGPLTFDWVARMQFALHAMYDRLLQLNHILRKRPISDRPLLVRVGLTHDASTLAQGIVFHLDELLEDGVSSQEMQSAVGSLIPSWRRYRDYMRIIDRADFEAAGEIDILAPRRQPCDLVALAAAAANLHVGRERVTLPERGCIYQGDSELLLRVFENLAANSSRFMTDDDDVLVRMSSSPDGTVVVEWENTGSVIEPQLAETVFKFGFTTKPDGLGIGLTISRHFVELHGGRIFTVPSPNTAVLRIELPPHDSVRPADAFSER